jgi:hypothetical protein
VTIDGPSSHTVLSGFERYQFTDGTVDNKDGNPLVDDLFYFARNHDVWDAHADADQHYENSGWHEGRDPNAFFSTSIYLSANTDVRAANVNPLTISTSGLAGGPHSLAGVRSEPVSRRPIRTLRPRTSIRSPFPAKRLSGESPAVCRHEP